MHFVVCIKQVPDSAQIRVHPVTNTIMRQGVPTIINPYDLFSLEEALRLRDKVGGEVTVLTMGPPMASDSLRKALTIGADRAVLLTDRFFAGSDTLATSYALAQAIRKIGEVFGTPDIVFAGKQTIDGDTAQVGPGIAKRLDLLQLTYVSAIVDIDNEVALDQAGAPFGRRHAASAIAPALPDHHARRLQCRAARQDRRRPARRPRRHRHLERQGRRHRGLAALRPARLAHRGEARVRPGARAEKAAPIELGANQAETAEALIETIFTKMPAIEADLTKLAAGF